MSSLTKDGNKPHFQILALSGGGYRGLFTAKVLEKLEEHAGKPIGQCFDLICGTSIGGIIALGLGLEKPAGDIARIIEERGKDIFHDQRGGFRRFCHNHCAKLEKYYYLNRTRYSNKNLESAVKEILGDNKLSDSKHRLIVPTVNYTNGKMQTFKTLHLARFSPVFDLPMWQVAMATSAAPTYFPIWQNPDSRKTYLDGGLVANAPGLIGVHEATCFFEQDKENIRLLSIGTMSADARLGDTSDLNKGLDWAAEFFDAATSAQESMADYMLKHILTEQRYHYINRQPTADEQPFLGLDKTDERAANILIGHADTEAQNFLGIPNLSDMLNHRASFITQPTEGGEHAKPKL